VVKRKPRNLQGVETIPALAAFYKTTEGNAMPKYSFRFNEVAMNQVWFEAENVAQAHALMKQCENGDINISDLPNAQERNRGIDIDFSVSMLESDSIS
jgi:hypothetical protein